MKKRLIVTTVVMAMLITVVGCGKKDTEVLKLEEDKVVIEEVQEEIDEIDEIVEEVSEEGIHDIGDMMYETLGIQGVNHDGTILISGKRHDGMQSSENIRKYLRVDSEGKIINVYDDIIENIKEFSGDVNKFTSILENLDPGISTSKYYTGLMSIDGEIIVEPKYNDTVEFMDNIFVMEGTKYDDLGRLGEYIDIYNGKGELIYEIDDSRGENAPIIKSTSPYSNIQYILVGDKVINNEGEINDLQLDISNVHQTNIESHIDVITVKTDDGRYIINQDGSVRKLEDKEYPYGETHNEKYVYDSRSKELKYYYYKDNVGKIEDRNFINGYMQVHGEYIDEGGNKERKFMTFNDDLEIVHEGYEMVTTVNKLGYIAGRKERKEGQGVYIVINDKDGKEIMGEDIRISDVKDNDKSTTILAKIKDDNNKHKKVVIDLENLKITDEEIIIDNIIDQVR